MEIFSTVASFQHHRRTLQNEVAFVPTMGYLHEGHLSLVKIAAAHAPNVVVSIFVNPTQFNDPRDLERYPRDLARDLELLRSSLPDPSVLSVFTPTPDEIYPLGFQTAVLPGALAAHLEGAFRPAHFQGVTTVVATLFNIVEADVAVFGEKDFQQLRIIEQMVKDLRMRTRIARGPLVREADGLAMSSRNVRLSQDARRQATSLSRGLAEGQRRYREGARTADTIRNGVIEVIGAEQAVHLEYIEVVDPETLRTVETVHHESRVLVAAVVGGVRLIDNVELGEGCSR